MTQFTCKGVKHQKPDIIKYDIHLYHSYLSAFHKLFFFQLITTKEYNTVIDGLTLSRERNFFFYDSIHVNLPAGAFFSRFWGSLPSLLITMTQFTCKGVKQIKNRISLNMTFTFTIRISLHFSSAREFQMGNFQKYWSQNVGQAIIHWLTFNWG
jgi:hypothetical protein